jgi:hypothetical protein
MQCLNRKRKTLILSLLTLLGAVSSAASPSTDTKPKRMPMVVAELKEQEARQGVPVPELSYCEYTVTTNSDSTKTISIKFMQFDELGLLWMSNLSLPPIPMSQLPLHSGWSAQTDDGWREISYENGVLSVKANYEYGTKSSVWNVRVIVSPDLETLTGAQHVKRDAKSSKVTFKSICALIT